MKFKAFLLTIIIFCNNQGYGMQSDIDNQDSDLEDIELVKEHDPKEFDADYADQIHDNYHLLFPYLHTHVNKKTSLDYVIFQRTEPVAKWIAHHAYHKESETIDKNIPALYYIARNFLKKSARHFSIKEFERLQEQFEESLVAMISCLQRVAFDVIAYYFIYHDPAVFTAYTIFKRKFHNLYTTNLPKELTFAEYPDFNNVCKTALQHWKNKGWYISHHRFTWVKTFNWYYPKLPYCWSLWFGPDPIHKYCIDHQSSSLLINEHPSITEEHARKIFVLVANIFAHVTCEPEFEVTSKYSSWSAFFDQAHDSTVFEFPYSKEQLDAALFDNQRL
jgi:hypothetical protein